MSRIFPRGAGCQCPLRPGCGAAGCRGKEKNSGQLVTSSEPGLGAETAAMAVAEEMEGTAAGVDAGSRASHSASGRNAAVAGAAGGGVGGGGGGGVAVTADARRVVRTAAGDVVTVLFQDVPDSGTSHTCCGSYNLSAVGQGYYCSSTDSQSEACLVGQPQGAGGSFQHPHSAGTVHDPGSGAVTEAAPSQV